MTFAGVTLVAAPNEEREIKRNNHKKIRVKLTYVTY